CIYCNPQEHSSRRDFLLVGSLSLLGVNLAQYLSARETMAATGAGVDKGRAGACILLWLDGGQSQVDSWDPKPTSSFKPISTNVPGIQISELLPKIARRMAILSIIRSVRTVENNHLPATHEVGTGHRPNASMKFPSFGSIVTKETGPLNAVPPYVM